MIAARHRLVSLDVLRGLTVAAMIIVNNPGNWLSVFPAWQHAAWNGCTLADLVFPFFVVIMGMAVALAIDARRAAGADLSTLQRRLLARAATLVALGLFLNAIAIWPTLGAMRIPGVLQRLGLIYGVTALLVLHLRPSAQALIGVVLLLGHWALLVWLPFGGQPAGIVTPSHNLGSWLDIAAFGDHLLTRQGDPEGLLGVLPSVATAISGALAGRWMHARRDDRFPISAFVVAGATAIAIGWLWSTVWPMNKSLWSGSFAVFSTGLALLSLAACQFFVASGRAFTRWMQPAIWLGMNPLAIYFGSELAGHLIDRPFIRRGAALASLKDIAYWSGFVRVIRDGGGEWSSLAFAFGYVGLWTAVAWGLYRRGLHVRV